MKLGDVLNDERVRALRIDDNAYVKAFDLHNTKGGVKAQSVEKVLFPQGYENANRYYNKNQFSSPQASEDVDNKPQQHSRPQNISPMFDMKSILPMLLSGKFNDVLKPLMSMFGGGGGVDIAKVFEMFKPKQKTKVEEKKEENISSKFDDFIIIED